MRHLKVITDLTGQTFKRPHFRIFSKDANKKIPPLTRHCTFYSTHENLSKNEGQPDSKSGQSATPFFSPTLKKYQSGPLINLAQYAVCSVIGFTSYFFARSLNKLKIDKNGRDTLRELVLNRPKGTPLITVSNHVSTIDDPFLWGLLPLKTFAYHAHKMRWSLGAQEICYTNWLTSMFFSFGKVMPVIRGNGVYQPGMNSALELLSKGDWIHIFPEGKVHQSGGILRFKWGVGRLIAESSVPPLVLLIYHTGLSKVYPLTSSGMLQQWLPKLFQTIKVQVSDPIDVHLLRNHVKKFDPPLQWKIITDYLQNKMHSLAMQSEGLVSKSTF